MQQGWYHEAAIKLKTMTGKACYIQYTTWYEKKQVRILSSNEVGYTEGLTVKRHSKKKKNQETITGPHAKRDYMTYFNAFDKNDHDSSFYLVTIRTIRYYLIIFCLELDCVVRTIFVVVFYLDILGIVNSEC